MLAQNLQLVEAQAQYWKLYLLVFELVVIVTTKMSFYISLSPASTPPTRWSTIPVTWPRDQRETWSWRAERVVID